MCNGTYALCDRAPCTPVPMIQLTGEVTASVSLCTCSVLGGWSLGAASCSQRSAYDGGGRTYIFSSYSNAFNDQDDTLVCTANNAEWTWCLGAPCVVDAQDPTVAYCTCPITTGAPWVTLGGQCEQKECSSSLWSAAPYDTAAQTGEYVYSFMKRVAPSQAVPPAKFCPGSSHPSRKPSKRG